MQQSKPMEVPHQSQKHKQSSSILSKPLRTNRNPIFLYFPSFLSLISPVGRRCWITLIGYVPFSEPLPRPTAFSSLLCQHVVNSIQEQARRLLHLHKHYYLVVPRGAFRTSSPSEPTVRLLQLPACDSQMCWFLWCRSPVTGTRKSLIVHLRQKEILQPVLLFIQTCCPSNL